MGGDSKVLFLTLFLMSLQTAGGSMAIDSKTLAQCVVMAMIDIKFPK